MLNFGRKFGIFCFLDNHEYEFNKSYECIAGAGVVKSITAGDEPGTGLSWTGFEMKIRNGCSGILSYDVKNEIEKSESLNPDGIQFPDIHFFIPEIVFILKKMKLQIGVYPGDDAAGNLSRK